MVGSLLPSFSPSPARTPSFHPQVGSGATALNVGKSDYFSLLIPPEVFDREAKTALDHDRVVIRDAEHLFYDRAFRRVFPHDADVGVERFGDDPCVACGFQVCMHVCVCAGRLVGVPAPLLVAHRHATPHHTTPRQEPNWFDVYDPPLTSEENLELPYFDGFDFVNRCACLCLGKKGWCAWM